MINWKSKFTSRKFWAALIGFVTAILTALNYDKITIEQTTALISAAGVLIAYILGESYVDANRTYANENTDSNEKDNDGFNN